MRSSCWSSSLFWVGCLLFGGLASPLWSQTAVFIQGVSQGVDTDPGYQADTTFVFGYLQPELAIERWDFSNWGSSVVFEIGRDSELGRDSTILARGLLRFPISSLKGQVTHLHRARLFLTLRMPYSTNIPYGQYPSPIHFELYRINPKNAGWIEGTSKLGDAEAKSVSWAWMRNIDTPWAGARGCGLPGIDYDSSPVSSTTLPQSAWKEGQLVVFDINQPEFLQSWIARPEENAGFLLRSSTLESLPNATTFMMVFYSDDAANPLLRPRLEVEYDAIPTASIAQASFQSGVAGSTCDTQATSLFAGKEGNYGAAETLCLGFEPVGEESRSWRSLLRFDLSRLRAMPTAARWMRLTLTVQSIQGGDTLSNNNPLKGYVTLQLHPVGSNNAAWKEGRSANGEAEPGAATWGWLAQENVAWAGGIQDGGGLARPDVDYVAQPLASRLMVPSELKPGDRVVFDFPAPGGLYRWIEKPETNAGFRLSAPALERVGSLTPGSIGKIQFYSDDAADPAMRPRLDVFYATNVPRSAADGAWRLAE